jgi:hypothetical protein
LLPCLLLLCCFQMQWQRRLAARASSVLPSDSE